MRTDLPPLEPEYVMYVMTQVLKGMSSIYAGFKSNLGATKHKDSPILLWAEFSNQFNTFWTRRGDVYEDWKQISSTLPPPSRTLVHQRSTIQSQRSAEGAVLESELAEISERLRQTRMQLEEERQKRHQLRDELDEARKQLDEERNRHRDVAKQIIVLEEDQMTHQVQVNRLREQVEQQMSLKDSLQLDLDRLRLQLFHAKDKYETALGSMAADNEALKKKVELLQLELQQAQEGGANKRDLLELESQNAVLRQVVDRHRRSIPNSRFADAADAASKAAFDAPQLSSQSQFINSLMEALDKAKFLNKQMVMGSDPKNNWSKQSWQDLSVGWREAVCELCDLFATAHRIESQAS